MPTNTLINKLQDSANTLRFLSADMVQKANSGHPGAAMGMADLACILSKHINLNPKNPKWLNRDRLVFSGGHASALLYSLLHLWGFDLSLDELKSFRQLNSKTPGHPEYGHTPGVEISTGPLGQGIANALGFAMSAKYAQNLLGSDLINHKVYCFCGDGDLQEGLSYEASASAGHLGLDNLILIYDSNKITIEGDTSLAWNEDVKKRFEASGFVIFEIDGHDLNQINETLTKAKKASKPVLIIANTIIAKGSVNLAGTSASHGSPLGAQELEKSKQNAGLNPKEDFFISKEAKVYFDKTKVGEELEKKWNEILEKSSKKEVLNALQNPDFSKVKYPEFEVGSKVATRDSNHQILNALAKSYSGFLGGSADLAPSNKTNLDGFGDFPKGRNIHFGIKEHTMAAATNAMNLYGLFRVYCATFFVFSDYLKPSARIAALASIPSHFVWTHDSIGVGEDGPTHQPIEQLSQFRALPNFYTFRPADAYENIDSWKVALKLNAPSAFVCSRQKLQVLKKDKVYGGVENGAYLLRAYDDASITILSSGSEVFLSLKVSSILNKEGIKVNVVSVPCFDLMLEQDKEYIDKIIKPNTKVFAIEAARGLEWYKYADEVFGMDTFGASGKAEDLFEFFGFDKHILVQKIKDSLKK